MKWSKWSLEAKVVVVAMISCCLLLVILFLTATPITHQQVIQEANSIWGNMTPWQQQQAEQVYTGIKECFPGWTFEVFLLKTYRYPGPLFIK